MKSNCIARIWNNGNGARCKNIAIIGDFCGKHCKVSKSLICKDCKCKGVGKKHLYTWEHLGRWDTKPPDFFKKKDCYCINIYDRSLKPYKIEINKIRIKSDKSLKLIVKEYYNSQIIIRSPRSNKVLKTIQT